MTTTPRPATGGGFTQWLSNLFGNAFGNSNSGPRWGGIAAVGGLGLIGALVGGGFSNGGIVGMLIGGLAGAAGGLLLAGPANSLVNRITGPGSARLNSGVISPDDVVRSQDMAVNVGNNRTEQASVIVPDMDTLKPFGSESLMTTPNQYGTELNKRYREALYQSGSSENSIYLERYRTVETEANQLLANYVQYNRQATEWNGRRSAMITAYNHGLEGLGLQPVQEANFSRDIIAPAPTWDNLNPPGMTPGSITAPAGHIGLGTIMAGREEINHALANYGAATMAGINSSRLDLFGTYQLLTQDQIAAWSNSANWGGQEPNRMQQINYILNNLDNETRSLRSSMNFDAAREGMGFSSFGNITGTSNYEVDPPSGTPDALKKVYEEPGSLNSAANMLETIMNYSYPNSESGHRIRENAMRRGLRIAQWALDGGEDGNLTVARQEEFQKMRRYMQLELLRFKAMQHREAVFNDLGQAMHDARQATGDRSIQAFSQQAANVEQNIQAMQNIQNSLSQNNLRITAARHHRDNRYYITLQDTQNNSTITLVANKDGENYNVTHAFSGNYALGRVSSATRVGGTGAISIGNVFSMDGMREQNNVGAHLRQVLTNVRTRSSVVQLDMDPLQQGLEGRNNATVVAQATDPEPPRFLPQNQQLPSRGPSPVV